MDIDFSASSSRLQRDAEKRRKAALEKKALEKKKEQDRLRLLAEQERVQQEREAERQLEQERLEEERAERELAELELCGGYLFEHSFSAVLIKGEEDEEDESGGVGGSQRAQEEMTMDTDVNGDAAVDLGAGQESDDKVILPESCLNELVALDLFGNPKHPALCFRLTVEEGMPLPTVSAARVAGEDTGAGAVPMLRRTHCGVREFTAAEGTIGIPHSVWNNLRLPRSQAAAGGPPVVKEIKIAIKFVLLPKITYLLVQPVQHAFTQHIVEIKRCLEENLSKYTTLSTGNVVTVWYRGNAYSMVVKTIKKAAASGQGVVVSTTARGGELPAVGGEEAPSAGADIEGGCLINTNVIIDFMESVEYQKQFQRQRQHQTATGAGIVKVSTGNTLGGGAATGSAAAPTSVFSGGFKTLAAAAGASPATTTAADSITSAPSAATMAPVDPAMTEKELMRQKRLQALQAREARSQN